MLKIEPIMIRFGNVYKAISVIDGDYVCIPWGTIKQGYQEVPAYRWLHVPTGVIMRHSTSTGVASVCTFQPWMAALIQLVTNPQISGEHIYQNLKLLGVRVEGFKVTRTYSGGVIFERRSTREFYTIEEFIQSI